MRVRQEALRVAAVTVVLLCALAANELRLLQFRCASDSAPTDLAVLHCATVQCQLTLLPSLCRPVLVFYRSGSFVFG